MGQLYTKNKKNSVANFVCDDVLYLIFEYMNSRFEINKCARVSKQWNFVARYKQNFLKRKRLELLRILQKNCRFKVYIAIPVKFPIKFYNIQIVRRRRGAEIKTAKLNFEKNIFSNKFSRSWWICDKKIIHPKLVENEIILRDCSVANLVSLMEDLLHFWFNTKNNQRYWLNTGIEDSFQECYCNVWESLYLPDELVERTS